MLELELRFVGCLLKKRVFWVYYLFGRVRLFRGKFNFIIFYWLLRWVGGSRVGIEWGYIRLNLLFSLIVYCLVNCYN